MTELKTLIAENASLIRELKYSVKEKQGVIEMLLEQLFREKEKVLELVEACEEACAALFVKKPKTANRILKQALAKIAGKDQAPHNPAHSGRGVLRDKVCATHLTSQY